MDRAKTAHVSPFCNFYVFSILCRLHWSPRDIYSPWSELFIGMRGASSNAVDLILIYEIKKKYVKAIRLAFMSPHCLRAEGLVAQCVASLLSCWSVLSLLLIPFWEKLVTLAGPFTCWSSGIRELLTPYHLWRRLAKAWREGADWPVILCQIWHWGFLI